MPYSRSLRRPSALIQSVVQAGARCSVTRAGPRPASSMRVEHVAARSPRWPGSRSRSASARPRAPSPCVDHVAHDAEVAHRQRRHLGVEHAVAAPAHARVDARALRIGGRARITTRLRDRRAAGAASRPGCSPCARCARRACRCCGRRDSAGSAQRRPRRASARISAQPGSRSSAQRGPRPLARGLVVDRVGLEQLGAVGPQRVERGLACARAIRRCRRPGAPPSRPHAAGGSALPSPPCRRSPASSASLELAQALPQQLEPAWRPSQLRSTREREVAARQLDQRAGCGSRARRAGRRAGPRRAPRPSSCAGVREHARAPGR